MPFAVKYVATNIRNGRYEMESMGLMIRLIGASLVLGGSMAMKAQAQESVQMTVSTSSMLEQGVLRDGQKVIRGQLVQHDEHAGFVLWRTNGSANSSNRFELVGVNDGRHIIRLRLTQDDWRPDLGHDGMVYRGKEAFVKFELEVDGDQQVTADDYVLQINAGSLSDMRG